LHNPLSFTVGRCEPFCLRVTGGGANSPVPVMPSGLCMLPTADGPSAVLPPRRLQVYPNPNGGRLTVDGFEGEIRVVDLCGRSVFRALNVRGKTVVDLAEAEPGLYLLVARSGHDLVVQRVVVESGSRD